MIQLRGSPFISSDVTQICVHTCRAARPLHPVFFKDMKTGITISPAWGFIPVAVCCPAQTLPSEQTRLHWWTEAGLFTPCVKVLWGWLTVSEDGKLWDELSGIWGDQTLIQSFCKPGSEIIAAFQVALGRWPIISSYELPVLFLSHLSSYLCLLCSLYFCPKMICHSGLNSLQYMQAKEDFQWISAHFSSQPLLLRIMCVYNTLHLYTFCKKSIANKTDYVHCQHFLPVQEIVSCSYTAVKSRREKGWITGRTKQMVLTPTLRLDLFSIFLTVNKSNINTKTSNALVYLLGTIFGHGF